VIKVKFTDVEQFFGEVMQTVDAHILRVDVVRIPTDKRDLVLFEVVAGLVNEQAQIVELVLSCGSTSPGSDGATRAHALVNEIRTRASDLGFNVRAGRFLAAENSA
jgi:hypothetical protein